MLDHNKIETIVSDYLKGTDKFLVEISVSSSNIINIYVDGDQGINISECVKLSRYVEKQFDREVEDYELRISSPGLDRPFKLKRQYEKYLNREIEVTDLTGRKMQGKLLQVSDNGVTLEQKKGKKSAESIIEEYLFEEIQHAKPAISFK